MENELSTYTLTKLCETGILPSSSGRKGREKASTTQAIVSIRATITRISRRRALRFFSCSIRSKSRTFEK